MKQSLTLKRDAKNKIYSLLFCLIYLCLLLSSTRVGSLYIWIMSEIMEWAYLHSMQCYLGDKRNPAQLVQSSLFIIYFCPQN